MCDCPHCQHHEEGESNSSFIFGLIIGLIVAAIIAIVIYKNRRSDVITTLKQKLTSILDPYLPNTPKSAVPVPSRKPAQKKPIIRTVATSTPAASQSKISALAPKKVAPKMFKVPRK